MLAVLCHRCGCARELVLPGHEPREHELRRNECGQPDERADPVVPRRCDEHRAGLRRRRRRGGLERGILGQDRPLERLQRRRRLDPEALDQRVPRRAVRLERLGLPAGAVQREHQLAAEALAQRVLGDEGLELGDERRMPAERELRLDPLLERREPQLLEPLDRPPRRTTRRRGRRAAARATGSSASRSSAAAAPASSRAARPLGLRRQALEAREVEVVVADAERVSGRPRLDRSRRAERAPQLRDLPLHLRDRGDGRAAGVQVVREPLDRHDAIRVQQQDRERRALPRPAEPDRAVVADDLERPQHAELEHSSRR